HGYRIYIQLACLEGRRPDCLSVTFGVKGNLTQAQNHPMRGKPAAARSAFGAGEKRPLDFSHQKLWGTITRRERWGLSWRGWSLVAKVVLFAAFLFPWPVYPFRAVAHRGDTIVARGPGWMAESTIRASV